VLDITDFMLKIQPTMANCQNQSCLPNVALVAKPD
jgi:hypothetical protein